MKHVLIITIAGQTVDRSQTLQTFTDALNTGPVKFSHALIHQVVYKIQAGMFTVSLNGIELKESFDTIHLRNHDKYPDYANAMRLYTTANGIKLVNEADSVLPYFGKLSQGALLAVNGVPTPDLLTVHGNQQLLDELLQADWPYPFVVKHNEGIRGVDNYLVTDETDLRRALSEPKQGFVAQPFIANTGELRVLTFGTEMPPLVFQKTAIKGQYLNNTSQGGTAEMMEVTDVPADILRDAQRAAQLMGRDIAGVDVILGLDGSYRILEVNSTPAIASGVYLTEKQAIYRQYFTDEGEV